MEDSFILTCFGCLGLLAIYVVINLAVAWCVEWAWNVFVPLVFHGPRIDYAAAVAICILLSLIRSAFTISSKDKA